MNPTAQKLLDAQVAYTLHQLSGDQIQKTIGDETKLIYQWVAKQNLSDIFSQERVKAFGQRLIKDASVSDSTKAYFESLTKAVLDDIAKEDIEIDDLITKNTWDRIVEKVVEKTEIIKEVPIITNEIKEIAKYETPKEIVKKIESLE